MTKNTLSARFWLIILIVAGFAWFGFRLMYGSIVVPPIFDIFTFVLFAPVAEELFFRGVIQDAIFIKVQQKSFGITFDSLLGLSVANLLTSIFFSLLHIPFWGVPHSLLVFFPSLAFGFLYDKSGRLLYPIILHAIYNLNTFIV